jgi:hypothetical protein
VGEEHAWEPEGGAPTGPPAPSRTQSYTSFTAISGICPNVGRCEYKQRTLTMQMHR